MNNSCSSYSLVSNGSRAPIIDLKVRVKDKRVKGDSKFKWSTINTKELYDNRRIVIFTIPDRSTYLFQHSSSDTRKNTIK